MTPSVAVVVPVKDGRRYLAELLAALAEQRVDEVLVIDSGSTDGSVDIARRAGVHVLEIAPAEFGHGRTRNLGAERTSSDLVAFLTQDATPVAGWKSALLEAFARTWQGVAASQYPALGRFVSPSTEDDTAIQQAIAPLRFTPAKAISTCS